MIAILSAPDWPAKHNIGQVMLCIRGSKLA
jgi:hypothetical protein